MPVIDKKLVPEVKGSKYPAAFDAPCRERRFRRLGEAGGLTRLGVTECMLPPGAWSSQRHWHAEEDEFLWVLEGELVLVTDEGETTVRAGDCAAFPAGERNGHCLQNRSDAPARFLAMSNRSDADWGEYPGPRPHASRRAATPGAAATSTATARRTSAPPPCHSSRAPSGCRTPSPPAGSRTRCRELDADRPERRRGGRGGRLRGRARSPSRWSSRGAMSGRAVLVIAAGSNRVDTAKVEALLGEPLDRPDADFVRAETGFAIGGIPPLGHERPLVTFIDQDLRRWPSIWAAAGHPNAVFPLTPEELERMTGGTVAITA